MDLGVACIGGCILFPPFILQTISLFSPNWVETSDCSSIGLVYSCCSDDKMFPCKNTNGVDELDARALGLEVTSFVIMFLAIAIFAACFVLKAGDSMAMGVGACSVIAVIVAEFLSFIGCMVIWANYQDVGWSFYVCFVPSFLVVFIVIMGIFYCVDRVVSKRSTGTSKCKRSTKIGDATTAQVVQRSDVDASRDEVGGRVVGHLRPSGGIVPTVTDGHIAHYSEDRDMARAQHNVLVHDLRRQTTSSGVVLYEGNRNVPSGRGVVQMDAQIEKEEDYAYDSETGRNFHVMEKYTIERSNDIFTD